MLPSEELVKDIGRVAKLTRTTWIGEHLAFILADRVGELGNAEAYTPGEPYNIGYTVSPPMNETTVGIVAESIERHQGKLGVPLLIENSPLYLKTPGSALTQVDFIRAICERSPVNLLLDLTHFHITALNFDLDIKKELLRLPLERVVEVHVSGLAHESDTYWDNHAARAQILFSRCWK